MSLKIQISEEGLDVRMILEGVLDENCLLPEFVDPIIGKLWVDLEKMTLINSMGARKWVTWIRRRADVKGGVSLVNCSPAVVNQINILTGFLPDYATVDSFFVPYYCEECGHEENILLTRGIDFDPQGHYQYPKEKPCPACSSVLIPDIIQDGYFKFIKKTA